ncbi:MAG TPA: HD domain-containing protein [Acidimicrobiales bacterium]|nr:HD domain-containing protein [Acidimicrobiales bacterium]
MTEDKRTPEGTRAALWASTMRGHDFLVPDAVVAHEDSSATFEIVEVIGREEREQRERATLAKGATLAVGAGDRALDEEPDPFRTCFERDRDRVLHSSSFRRLAGKTQVFVFPDDHQRTRLTHALEVAQVATAISRALGLNTALTEAIALAHDCGHGPGGHPSEEAFAPFLEGGYDHAVWGAEVTLAPLNLTGQVLDGVRNHSWSRPAPFTPEGEVLSWADRCAYCAHDLEDAISAGIVNEREIPAVVRQRCGTRRNPQLNVFVRDLIETSRRCGRISMSAEMAEALAALRTFNYERIYTRDDSLIQGERVARLLSALVEYFIEHPVVDGEESIESNSDLAVRRAVTYVGGMTDRYACLSAVRLLNWPVEQLPVGLDVDRS